MLDRKVTARLEDWRKSHGGQALLVTGARQVGKSFIVDAFARARYEHFVSFDLVEQADLCDAMNGCRNADELFKIGRAHV